MRRSFLLLSFYGAALALLSILVPISGLVWIALTPRVASYLALLSVGGAGLFVRWLGRKIPGARPLDVSPATGFGTRAAFGVVAASSGLAYLLLWIVAYHRPDFTWDGMTYHLPTVQFWAERGFVHWIDLPHNVLWAKNGDSLFNGYPKGAEVVAFFLSTISNGKLVNAPNLVYLPLAFLGIAYVARELGARRPTAAAAGMLFVIVPTNVGQAASTYVDTAYASAVVAFFAATFAMIRAAARGDSTRLVPLGVVGGVLLGLALGVKAPAVALGPLAAVAVVGAGGWAAAKSRLLARFLLRTTGALLAMAAVAVVVGGFWYARNFVHTGNPLFPVEVKVAGHVVFPGVPVKEQIAEEPNTPPFMASWSTTRKVFYTWRQSGRIEWPIDARVEHNEQGYAIDVPEAHEPAWPRSIRYQDPRSGGLGVLWLGGAVPAMLICACVFLRRLRHADGPTMRARARTDAITFFVFGALLALYFFITPMRWWARYTVWLFALGLPALALVADLASSRVKALRGRVVHACARIALACLLATAFFEFGYALKWDHTPAYFVGPPCAYSSCSPKTFWRALTSARSDGVEAIYMDLAHNELAREAFASASTVAVSALSVANGPALGQLSMPPGVRHVVPMDFDVGREPAAAAAFIAKHLPRYIVWDHETGGDAPVLRATATRWTWLRSMMVFEFGPAAPAPKVLPPK